MSVEIVEFVDRKGRSPFGEWFDRLPAAAAAKVVVALDRISRGLLGDVKSVGNGVSERRIDFGPGYRIYFASVRTLMSKSLRSDGRNVRLDVEKERNYGIDQKLQGNGSRTRAA